MAKLGVGDYTQAGVVGVGDKWLIGTRILAPPVESHACSKTGKAWHNWAWWKVTLAQRLKKLGKLGVGDYTQAGVVGFLDKWLIVTQMLAPSVESHVCKRLKSLEKLCVGEYTQEGVFGFFDKWLNDDDSGCECTTLELSRSGLAVIVSVATKAVCAYARSDGPTDGA